MAPSVGGVLTLAGLLACALSLPALVAAAASDEPLDVSVVQYQPTNSSGAAFWMWVTVANPGNDSAENLTAAISGPEVLAPPDTTTTFDPSLGRGASDTESFEVYYGASVDVSGTVDAGTPLATVMIVVTAPDGTKFNGTGGRTSSVSASPGEVDDAGPGTWTVEVTQVTGVTAASCTITISVSGASGEAEQSLDALDGGASYTFRWLVAADNAPNPPHNATIVVEATVTDEQGASEDVEYTAAFGKAVENTNAPPPSDELPPAGPATVLAVAFVWLLAPIAWWLMRRQRQKAAATAAAAREGRPKAGATGKGPRVTLKMLRKVPEITLYFWVIKVLCTTVGETAADQLNLTGLASPVAFGLSGTNFLMTGLLAAALVLQFMLRKYVPGIYWVAVVLISVVGTLITDFLHDDLGVSLEALTAVFTIALAATFAVWFWKERTLSIHSIYTTRREGFYWAAILATFALGTAAGDLGLERLAAALGQVPSAEDPTVMVALHPQTALLLSAAVFGGVILAAYIGLRAFKLNAVLMFWIAYIFTRPLGANIGDLLTLAPSDGGMGLDKVAINLVFLAAIVGSVYYLTITKKDVFKSEAVSKADAGAKVEAEAAAAAAGASTSPEE